MAFHESRSTHRFLVNVYFPCYENSGKEHEADEQADDDGTVPGVTYAAVLHGEDVAGDACYHQACSDGIHLEQLGAQSPIVIILRRCRVVKEKGDEACREGADG